MLNDLAWLDEILFILIQFSQDFKGQISLTKGIQGATNDISNGLPILYRVEFPIQYPLPKVTEIYYNDQQICLSPRGLMFTLTIEFSIY